MVTDHHTPQIEIEIDRKAQRQSEKMLRSHWDEMIIHNYFATPLAGTFLNLPTESCLLQCPCCGIKDMTRVVLEVHHSDWTGHIVTKLFSCCFCPQKSCCQRALDHRTPSHYCNNCGCYFGKHKLIDKLKLRTDK